MSSSGALADGQQEQERRARNAWLGGLCGVIIGPPTVWILTAPPGPIFARLSTLTGLFAVTALVCTIILPSRVRAINRAFGIESVIEVHRFLGISTAVLTVVHLACVVALDPSNSGLLLIAAAPARAVAAGIATMALLLLVFSPMIRKRFDLRYEVWRYSHAALAVVALLGAAGHVWLLDQLVRDSVMVTVFLLLLLGVLGVLLHRWIWRVYLDPTTEFLVADVRWESDTVSTLVLRPRDTAVDAANNWRFAPGQFAWIRFTRGIGADEHPFTIASSAHLVHTEFTIRHTGDFTNTVRTVTPGTPVWVDGPHGAFTSDSGKPSGGFVLHAGGVGITPMMSILRTAAHRGDSRPFRLIVIARSLEDLLFREELNMLRTVLDLEVTEVLRRPGDGWTGRTGGLSVELLSTVVGSTDRPTDLEHFICGPPGMVTDAIAFLAELGVESDRVHTEMFDFA